MGANRFLQRGEGAVDLRERGEVGEQALGLGLELSDVLGLHRDLDLHSGLVPADFLVEAFHFACVRGVQHRNVHPLHTTVPGGDSEAVRVGEA